MAKTRRIRTVKRKAAKTTTKRSARPRSAVTVARLIKAHLDTPDARGGRSPKAASAVTTVVFKCDNPRCAVTLKPVELPGFTFFSVFAISMPAGSRLMSWSVISQPSGEAFAVTATNATLNPPVSGITGPNSTGVTTLSV